ncbi:MAG: hypothetical protein ABI810_15905 [Sphingomonas bacterium]
MTNAEVVGARTYERWVILAAVLVSALPMIWPGFAPLVDAPGHIGQYRILVEAGRAPLAQHYLVHWALISNFGVDALVIALAQLLDVELAAHIVIGLIPPLTVAAMLLIAREAHGRIPPAAGFALPLAYALPFQLGFLNFSLAIALALLSLALWIRLARRARLATRLATFLPIAGVIWTCHTFGWAMFGLFIFGAEFAIRVENREPRWRALLFATLTCAPMAWPQLLATILGGGVSGETGEWLRLGVKLQFLVTLLQERWKFYDVACICVIVMLLWGALRVKSLSFVPVLAIPALLTLAVFIALPRIFMGGVFVDLRLLPCGVALSLLAIRVEPDNQQLERRLVLGGAAFFGLRALTSTIAFILYAQAQQAELQAAPLIPEGSAVLSLVNQPSAVEWVNPRFAHLAGIAVARRRIFTNEQWGATRGQQLIEQLHPNAAPLLQDPSQIVYPTGSRLAPTDFDEAIAHFDRGTFGYVWTIGFPPGQAHAADLMLIWANEHSALYRVVPRQKARLSIVAPHR